MSVKNKVILVGTYHKTGTVWMMKTFREIAGALDIPFTVKERDEAIEVRPGIYFDSHCLFTEAQLKAADGGFRMIRDPRDVIISGTFYHIKAAEDWLRKPQIRFDGLSYAEAISKEPADHARFVFEMKYVARRTIAGMGGRWKVGRAASYIEPVMYEDLIEDFDTSRFSEVLKSLGFNDEEVEIGRNIFLKNSLFGGAGKSSSHVRSGKKETVAAAFY